MPVPGKNFVSGTIGGTMLKTAVAMIPGTLAISGFNLADTYFVSQLGSRQQAAIGLTFPVIMLLGCFFRGITIGVMTTSSHALGERKQNKAANLTTLGLIFLILFSMMTGFAGYLSMNPTFRFFGVEDAVLPYVKDYMSIWYLGCVTSALCMTVNDLLVASGVPLFASMLMIVGLALNIVLDPIFMFSKDAFTVMGRHVLPFGMNLGTAGAAYATVLSQAFGAFAGLIVLSLKFHMIHWQKFPVRMVISAWKQVIRFAFPAAVGMLMMPIGMFILTKLTAKYGTAAVAASTAAGRLESLAFIFPMSLGIAIVPMVAQNFGAKQYERIDHCRRFAVRTAGGILIVMAAVCILFAPQLASILEPPDNPAVKPIMISYLRIVPLGFAFLELHRYGGFFFTGCGKPSVAAYLNALRIVVLMIPLSYGAYFIFGTDDVSKLFWARAISDIVSGTVALIAVKILTSHLLRKYGPVGKDASGSGKMENGSLTGKENPAACPE